jgi:hypothetical protein
MFSMTVSLKIDFFNGLLSPACLVAVFRGAGGRSGTPFQG